MLANDAELECRGNFIDGQVDRPSRRLLICADWFDPGVRAGGPIRSCVNLVNLIADSVDIRVITSDKDHGATNSYPDLPSDTWVDWHGRAKVLYSSSAFRRIKAFSETMRTFQPDVLYLNSMFSTASTLWPLWRLKSMKHSCRTVLAPRGMLKPSALQHKSAKKRLVLSFLRTFGLVRNVTFHGTSDDEMNEISQTFASAAMGFVSNVPCQPADEVDDHQKVVARANICFIGRIHPIKNLLWLIQLLKRVNGTCKLTVVGPVEDQAYYEKCQKSAAELPSNVTVEFVGLKSETEVREILRKSDAMVMPTLGENFGHAIFEALAAGSPVIVSDRTVWRNLASRQAGWDVSLDDPDSFVGAIDTLISMDDRAHRLWREGALSVARRFIDDANLREGYYELFFPTQSVATNDRHENKAS